MAVHEPRRMLSVLDAAECRRLLATATFGRLTFTGEDVVIPAGPDSRMAAGSRGAVVAFEVDDYDLTERTGWNVTVIGPSRLISLPGQVAALDTLGVQPWAPVMTYCYIALHMAVVRGRRISSSVRVPIAGPGRRGLTASPAD
jgi:hypothetical protein